MTRDYPLNALRAFEASARHLSFVKAAGELHVTPAAVSHQVKNLEEYLGLQLFRRLPRGLVLVEAGEALLGELRDVFTRLDGAIERVLDSELRGPLTISVAPMFAVKWLLPRLRRFDALHPEIDVRMSTNLGLVDFQRDSVDAAIRLGGGRYPGLTADLLCGESVTPMCSPRLEQDHHPLRDPGQLAEHVLLHDDSLAFESSAPGWETWLDAAGVRLDDPSRGPRFAQPDHALQAAIDGAGVVLGWCNLAADDLAAGRLVAPFERRLPLGASFYLVYPDAHADRPKVAAFRDWIRQEMDADDV